MPRPGALKLDIEPMKSVDQVQPQLVIPGHAKITESGITKEGEEKKRYNPDDFIVIRPLGKGQFGTVDLIQNRIDGSTFAKKIIPIPPDASQIKQLTREISTMMDVKSRYCVKMHTAYIKSSRLNIIMEYMDCGTLHDLLKVGKPHPVPESVVKCIAYDLFNGLDYLHNKKDIIHRDIKPLNVLVSSDGVVKISDFGLAAKLEGTIKATATFVGTTIYMSPERLRGMEYTMTSDVWSMGLVIAELLLGEHPFMIGTNASEATRGGVFFGLLEQISKEDPVRKLDSLELSPECLDFLSKALNRDFKARMTSEQAIQHPWLQVVGGKKEYRQYKIKSWIKEVEELKQSLSEKK